MVTFITRLPVSGGGVRLAVKDLIDVAGVPTTAGSRALAVSAGPAERDALCLGGARAAGARIVGKANLNELAFGASGVNEHFGTPVNPLDPGRVPGGSSSGSAVAVAGGEADLAYGSDTGGSVRVPAAFCGIHGLVDDRIDVDAGRPDPADPCGSCGLDGETRREQRQARRDARHIPCHRADGVQTGRQRPHALERNPAVRRLQAGDAAERSRDPDRAAGVRAISEISLATGHRHRRSAG